MATCERLARGEGRGRVYCEVHNKALPVMQFFKARGYRPLRPGENTVAGMELPQTVLERML